MYLGESSNWCDQPKRSVLADMSRIFPDYQQTMCYLHMVDSITCQVLCKRCMFLHCRSLEWVCTRARNRRSMRRVSKSRSRKLLALFQCRCADNAELWRNDILYLWSGSNGSCSSCPLSLVGIDAIESDPQGEDVKL